MNEYMNEWTDEQIKWMEEWKGVVVSHFCTSFTNFRPPCKYLLYCPPHSGHKLFICNLLTLALWQIYLFEVLQWVMLLCTCLEALRKDMVFKYQINRIDIQSIHYFWRLRSEEIFFQLWLKTGKQFSWLIIAFKVSVLRAKQCAAQPLKSYMNIRKHALSEGKRDPVSFSKYSSHHQWSLRNGDDGEQLIQLQKVLFIFSLSPRFIEELCYKEMNQNKQWYLTKGFQVDIISIRILEIKIKRHPKSIEAQLVMVKTTTKQNTCPFKSTPLPKASGESTVKSFNKII